MDELATVVVVTLAIATGLAGVGLGCALRAEGRRTSALSADLMSTTLALSTLQQTQQERLHDARSVVVGVTGACALLTAPGPITISPFRLHDLVAAELDRLAQLLDVDAVEAAIDFDLAIELESVLLAHQLAGARLHTELASVVVHGRPRAVAGALENLLRNARTHAPGASVVVRLVRQGDRAVLIVDDDGPGIPPGAHETVLGRGVRAPSRAEPSSGLGLHIAATTLAEQGGSLRLTDRPRGGTRVVVELPLARSRGAAARPLLRTPAGPARVAS